MVIDNLIGVCDPGAEINSTTGVGPALARIQHICDVAGTSVLLLHHTSKPGPTGRSGRTPVGSFQVGAKARKTLLLDADDRDREHKTLEVTDNNSGGSKTHFWMTPFAWELRERSAKQVRVNRDMDRRRDVAALLLAAPSQARRSSSALGVYLFERGLAPSPEAGRKKVSRLLATHVLALGEDGQIGPGPNAQDLQTGQR